MRMKPTDSVIAISMALALLVGCGARKNSNPGQYYGSNYYGSPPPYAYPGYGPPPPQGYGPPAPQAPPYYVQPQPASPMAPPPPPPPGFARVSLTGMLIGPGKVDGTQWDGPGGTVDTDDWAMIASALSRSNPYAAAASVMAGPAMQALEKPDVGGSATLVTSSGDGDEFGLAKNQDSFAPNWTGVTWDHVPLDGSARIRVVAIDRDLADDDPMGIFEISASDINQAIQVGRIHPVPVHQQTGKQILFALISAMPQ